MPTKTDRWHLQRTRAQQLALRFFWFTLVPLFLSVFAVRYLVPFPTETAADTWLQSVPPILARAPLVVGGALFIIFAWLVRHWSPDLPGSSYLSPLPIRLLDGRARACVRENRQIAELFGMVTEKA